MSRDYRRSHMDPKKGAQYADAFASSRWLRYVMDRELSYLMDIINVHCLERRSYLDFACGTGRILRLLGNRFSTATGIDVSPSMLAVARETCQHEIIEGDLTRDATLLGARKFDLITAFRFFPNAEPQLRTEAMRAIAAHLSEHGVLVFNNHQNSSSTLVLAHRALRREIPWSPMHHREAVELIHGAGLRVLETREIGVLPATDRRIVVPPQVHSVADNLASAFRLSRLLAQNVLYVCSRR